MLFNAGFLVIFDTSSTTISAPSIACEYADPNDSKFDEGKLNYFKDRIDEIKSSRIWKREDLVHLFHEMIPDFGHKDTGKFLDQKM